LIINSGQSLNTKTIGKFFLKDLFSKTNHNNYRSLPINIASYIIFDVTTAWVSFFNALSDYNIFPNKYLGRPRPPKYLKDKHKVTYDVHDICNMNKQTREKLKFNKSFKLSGTNIEFELNHKKGKLKQVIINPTIIGFNLEFIYETIKPDLKPYNGRVVGVDLGVSNLMTVVNNYDEPFYIVNSKPIASINRYSNKKISNLQKKLEKNIHTSRQIMETYLKRKFKLDYELNCVSKYLVEECVKQNVTKIIIGNNKG
jgi:putative transposase